MAQVVVPYTNTIITKETTREGEITVNIVLTLKLEGLTASAEASSVVAPPVTKMVKTLKVEDDDLDFMIPDLKSEGLIDFGKKV